jgi:hypothetical protein
MHNRQVKKRSGFANDVPLKKWTIVCISLPVAQIQPENSSSKPSVTFFCYKSA